MTACHMLGASFLRPKTILEMAHKAYLSVAFWVMRHLRTKAEYQLVSNNCVPKQGKFQISLMLTVFI